MLSLATVLRVLALLSLKESVYFDFLLWDERLYHTWAVMIAEGAFQSRAVYEFAPLPAYLFALVYKLLSPDPLWVRLLNILFGVTTCYLVYRIGHELGGRVMGLASCLLSALFEPFILFSIVPLKASLSACLFALVIYLLLAGMEKSSAIIMLFLGLSLGFLLNVRPQSAILVPLLPLIILWHACKTGWRLKTTAIGIVVYAAGLAIAVSPFVIRNYRVSGQLALMASQSGFNLYLANDPRTEGPYFRPVPFASTSPFEQGVQFTIEASKRAGRKLTSGEASSYWTGETVRAVLDQPAAALWKLCQKTIVFFQEYQPANHYDIGFVSRFVPFFRFPFPWFSLVLSFGMAGMLLRIARCRKSLALGLVFLFYGLTQVLFFTTSRYRLPVLVVVIPFAAMGVFDLCRFLRGRQWRPTALYACTVVLFSLVSAIPLPGKGDMTAYYNTHAIALDACGFKDEAMEYWEESSRMQGRYSEFANLSLAGKYMREGKMDRSLSYLDKIPDGSYAAALKYDLLGDILLHRRDVAAAVNAYERSLRIHSGQRNPRRKLIKLYWRLDRQRALEEHEKLEYVSSFYEFP
ncbi:MAG: glycosyltransferase family 39 protein [Thermodesulfobacteriota bacterium]